MAGSFFVSFRGWVALVVGLALVAVAVLFYHLFVHFLLLEGWWGTAWFWFIGVNASATARVIARR